LSGERRDEGSNLVYLPGMSFSSDTGTESLLLVPRRLVFDIVRLKSSMVEDDVDEVRWRFVGGLVSASIE
jgi:hypothetical protein